MGLTPVSFTGFSEFSDSFQEILKRTFEAANVPIQRLETEQELITERRTQLEGLSDSLLTLEKAFRSLAQVAGNGALAGTTTDESVATATVTGNPEKLSFALEVTSAASAAQEASLNALADRDVTSLSTQNDGLFTLTVGETVTNIALGTLGAGRTAGMTGTATPSPPVSVQVDFSNGLSGSITAELKSFFVTGGAPSGATAGDTVTVQFLSADGAIDETIVTASLGGGEDAAAIAALLNDQIALNGALSGKLSFSDAGGNLKLVVNDTAGQGFSFSSSSSGSVVTGLEAGGDVGGHSAEEIATALNAQVASNPTLTAAGVRFSAANGEVHVSGDSAFDITVTDQGQATGFSSGLSGTHAISEFSDTLEGLRDFINSKTTELGVKASIINTSSQAGGYRLVLTATQSGETTLLLEDSALNSLVTTSNQGSNAVFEVNGVSVNNTSNTITDFIPGLDLTIVGPGSATISSATDRSSLSQGLAAFVEAYNATAEALRSQVGSNAGLLSGSIEVRQAQQTLRRITSFVSSEGLHSARELGVDLQSNGQIEFDFFTFNFLDQDQLQGAITFLGDLGSGFAGNAIKLLGNLTNPVSGQFKTAINFARESDERLSDQIFKSQERLDQTIRTLEQRFAAADLLLSQLESQQTALTAFLEAQKDANRR